MSCKRVAVLAVFQLLIVFGASEFCDESLISITTPAGFGQPNFASENFDLRVIQGESEFIVGSDKGFVFTVNCSGASNQFTFNDTSKFVTGVKINPFDGNLYALFTNFPPIFNAPNQSFVGVFDLRTGAEIAYIDLTPYANVSIGSLANDMYFRPGKVFISDSLSNRIYVLDTKTNQASLWAASQLFAGTPSKLVGGLSIGLEGMFSPAGANFIIASKFSDGSGADPGAILLKVPDEDPDNPTIIPVANLTATLAGGLDGIYYDDNCNLYGANAQGNIYRIYTLDNWDTAIIDEVAPVPVVHSKPALGPTVSVVLTPTGEIYALNAGGFNPQGAGTIDRVEFTSPPIDRCGSTSPSFKWRKY